MSRVLSIVLLAALLAGFAGTPAVYAGNSQAVVLSQANGDSGAPMGVPMMTGRLSAFSYWLLERFPALGHIG